jgi:hypothetical protein
MAVAYAYYEKDSFSQVVPLLKKRLFERQRVSFLLDSFGYFSHQGEK